MNSPPPISIFYQCQSMLQFKQAHARLLLLGHVHLPLPALRPIISFSSLHPAGDLHYALRLLLLHHNSSSPSHLLRSSSSSSSSSSSLYLFNTLIRGLARHPSSSLLLPASILLLRRMSDSGLQPNNFTFTFLFQASSAAGSLGFGRQLHPWVVKNGFSRNGYVRNSVVQFYSVCGGLDEARRAFSEGGPPPPDIVSWNSLVSGCLRRGEVEDAFVLFDKMPEKNVVSWNSMMSGLVRNGRLDAARCLFDEMPDRNMVSWTVMVTGYSQSGRAKEALLLFREMQMINKELNSAVLVSGLSAASQLGALEHGKWIHGYIRKNRVHMETSLSTALVTMYSNCGNVDMAMQVFYNEALEKDVSTYTAAAFGLAVSGHGKESLEVFEQMKNKGIEPDGVSYIAVLCACSHMGWVEKGYGYFSEMVNVCGKEAELDHYACMVDLLGRAGFLEEAERFIASMPIAADNAIWGALLNACRIHGNSEMGQRVGKILIESDCWHDGRYIILSNIYAESGMGENAEGVRKIMRKRKVKRVPGFSSIELNGIVQEFTSGDKSHDRADEVYLKWEEIVTEIRKVGYAEETSRVIFDVEEEEKEGMVGYHSEKLAIAFGFVSTEQGTPLRIVKNIRICRDCHSAAKFISLVFKRTIIIRDRKRFHHFEGGTCSCLDYWQHLKVGQCVKSCEAYVPRQQLFNNTTNVMVFFGLKILPHIYSGLWPLISFKMVQTRNGMIQDQK